jgi:hypothetical protein
LKNQVDEMSGSVLKLVDFSHSQEIFKREMEDKMENLMDKRMEQLQNSILHTLDERLPKGDIKMQGNHENKENNSVEPQSHMGNISTQLGSMNIESQNHDHSSFQDLHHRGFNSTPRNYLIPKIDMRKFDGKDPITWIFQMEQFFDLHQVSTLQKVTLASLYLENDQFVWYQWLCE